MNVMPQPPGHNPEGDIAAATERLRAAMLAKDRYIVVTDHERTHLGLVGLAIRLAARGVRPESLSYGVMPVVTSTGARVVLSFLAFPRAVVHPTEFFRWASELGYTPDRLDARRDILVASRSPELIATVLAAIADGDVRVLGPAAHN